MGKARRRGDAVIRMGWTIVLASALLALTACGTSPVSHPSVNHATVSAKAAPPAFFSLPATTTHTVDLWSWSGQRIGRFGTDPVAECCSTVAAAPDGHELEILDRSGAEIVNATGRRLGHVAVFGTWADDNRHICALKPTDPKLETVKTSGELLLADPSGHVRRVATIPDAFGDHLGSSVGWCSVKHNEAVILFDFMGGIRQTEVVRLSTGAVLDPAWEGAGVADWVGVSGDGRYVAAIGHRSQGVVVDAVTGKIVANLPAQPDGLSWDGHLIVGLAASTSQEKIINWVTGKTLWVSGRPYLKCPCRIPNVALSSEPGTDAVAVAVTNTPTSTPPVAALWLVSPAGKPKLLSRRVQEGAI